MLFAFGLLAAALIAAVIALVVIVRTLTEQHREAEAQWALERRELLNRIQRPEHVPVTERAEFVIPDREPDEWAKVGQIEFDPEYGLDEE